MLQFMGLQGTGHNLATEQYVESKKIPKHTHECNRREADSDIDHKLVVTHKEEVERQCRDWRVGDTNHCL